MRTHLGYGSPHKQDTYQAHGLPLGTDEVAATKRNLDWPLEPPFFVPDDALAHFREAQERGRKLETGWSSLFAAYRTAHPDLAAELARLMKGELPAGWDASLPRFTADSEGLATRMASGKIMTAMAPRLAGFVGRSADLDPSTYTALAGLADFENPERRQGDIQGSTGGGWSYGGRNLHFGVREHGMGAIVNGMAAHGGTIPYASTFLIFSDYMRPAIRLAALMELHVIYVFTHDSIALGEDGPTYQPVEQLLALRSIPGLILLRRADANETVAASNRKREGRILEKGARAQRLRWASNSTKDPSFSDVKYIDTLIGPETINTVPLETLNAYRDHGDPSSRLEEGTEKAEAAIERLPQLGIDLAKLTQQLEDEGVAKFTTLC